MVKLWWKVKDIGHLRPVRKVVHRLGRHGDLQVFLQTFYEAPEQPEHASPEHTNIDELLTTAKVRQWYDDLRDEFDRKVDRLWKDPAWGLGREDWVRLVNNTHKELKDTYGSDRVAIVLSAEDPSLKLPLHRGLLGLAYFAILAHYHKATLLQYALDKLGLPYTYWHAVASTLSETMFNTEVSRVLSQTPALITPLLIEEGTTVVDKQPLPDTVIDPNSKKEILTDDYFKRMLPLLDEVLGEIGFAQLERINRYLPGDAHRKVIRGDSVDAITFRFRHPDTELALNPKYWDDILNWIKEHPETLKAIFSFVVPTGDRDIALLGFYAGIRTIQDFVKLCASPDLANLSAADILERVQADFERRVEEGKQLFGLGRFSIPPHRVWEALWTTMDTLYDMGVEEESEEGGMEGGGEQTAVSLRRLVGWQHWERSKWSTNHSDLLKHAVEALFGQDAAKNFDDTPLRFGRLGEMIYVLWYWGTRLQHLGLLALGESHEQLRERVKVLDPEKLAETGDHQQLAQKAVRKFHNTLSSVIKSVQKVKEWLVGRFGGASNLVAIVDYSPLGFFSLTRDGTCFSGSNKHHPYLLSALNNSFVLRIFAPDAGYLGRAWGLLFPDAKTAYITNRYGRFNITHLKVLARRLFAILFQTHPDNLSIEDTDRGEMDGILYTQQLTAKEQTGVEYAEDELPYLNGDAFKISIKSRG
jgi:hypothetical protein